MAILCPDLWAEYEKLYDDWKKCDDAGAELLETMGIMDATAATTCGGAVAVVETVVGGVIGGAACLIALWAWYDSIDDLNEHVLGCMEKFPAIQAAADAYDACVEEHKSDP